MKLLLNQRLNINGTTKSIQDWINQEPQTLYNRIYKPRPLPSVSITQEGIKLLKEKLGIIK